MSTRRGQARACPAANATAAGQVLAVSLIALTDAACKDVYASAGYEASARNFPRTTLQSDNVFGGDGASTSSLQ